MAPSSQKVPRSPGKSRVTNGAEVLPGIDGRSLLARRYRDISMAIAADQGGEDRLAEVRAQLIRRFSAVSVLAEEAEARMARGEKIDVAEHALLCSSAVRIASKIGINRRLKEVVPSLEAYLETREEQDDDDDQEDDE